MNRLESAIERLQALLTVMAVMTLFTLLTSCSYSTKCPTYSHHNKKTKHGEKSQLHYVKKHKKILCAYLVADGQFV